MCEVSEERILIDPINDRLKELLDALKFSAGYDRQYLHERVGKCLYRYAAYLRNGDYLQTGGFKEKLTQMYDAYKECHTGDDAFFCCAAAELLRILAEYSRDSASADALRAELTENDFESLMNCAEKSGTAYSKRTVSKLREWITGKAEIKPCVSVIIPVYNAEKYLNECIDSVLEQTNRDFEVLVVNDGSSDRSGEILKQYSMQDIRISVIDQPNSGAGAARNNGIAHAKGQWLCFVDSDDYIDKNMLEITVSLGEAENADIVLSGLGKFYGDAGETEYMPWALRMDLLPDKKSASAKELQNRLFQLTYTGPCSKLYRRELIEQCRIEFPDLRNSEDISFVMESMASAKRIAWTDRLFYHYRKGFDGSNQSSKAKYPREFMKGVLLLKEYLRERDIFDALETSFAAYVKEQVRFNFFDPLYASVPLKIRREILEELELTGIMDTDGRVVTSKDEPVISVIIPVYNAEKNLEACLDSLLAQTFQKFEVIAVDDGSTDSSPKILQKYAKRDERILVLRQENAGAAVTRNYGMSLASGEYLYFMDADDLAMPTMLEEAYAAAVHFRADITIWSVEILDEQTGVSEPFPYICKSWLFPKRFHANAEEFAVYAFQFTTSAPWNKLFRRKFVEQINAKFQVLPNSNDLGFVYTCLGAASRLTWVDKCLYIYRRGCEESTQSRKFKNPDSFARALLYAKSELIRLGKYDRVRESFDEEYINFTSWNLRDMSVGSVNEEKRQEIIEMLGLSDEVNVHGKRTRPPRGKRQVEPAYGIRKLFKGKGFRHKLKAGVRCLRQRGIVYTLRRIAFHVGSIKK